MNKIFLLIVLLGIFGCNKSVEPNEPGEIKVYYKIDSTEKNTKSP